MQTIDGNIATIKALLSEVAQNGISANKPIDPPVQTTPDSISDSNIPSSVVTGTSEGVSKSTPSVGDKITDVTGKWYADEYGEGKSGAVDILGANSWEITKIANKGDYPYHLVGYKDGKKAGSGWVNLDSLPHYAKGLKNSPKDHWAITQDGGDEIIVREDGSVLTRVGLGDYILSLQGTKNMVDMSENPEEFIKKHMTNVPSTVINDNLANQQQMLRNIGSTNINNNRNITMENHFKFDITGVNDINQIIKEVKYDLQHDHKFESMMEDMTINKLAGGTSMDKYKYHWD